MLKYRFEKYTKSFPSFLFSMSFLGITHADFLYPGHHQSDFLQTCCLDCMQMAEIELGLWNLKKNRTAE